jgi:hypothetical protein
MNAWERRTRLHYISNTSISKIRNPTNKQTYMKDKAEGQDDISRGGHTGRVSQLNINYKHTNR